MLQLLKTSYYENYYIDNNQILQSDTGIVPDKLKLAKVIPVYKKGDHSLPQNYRPISLLSIFHKILEKIMAKRLKDFLTTNSIFTARQLC